MFIESTWLIDSFEGIDSLSAIDFIKELVVINLYNMHYVNSSFIAYPPFCIFKAPNGFSCDDVHWETIYSEKFPLYMSFISSWRENV